MVAYLLPKQTVVGSNPITRSSRFHYSIAWTGPPELGALYLCLPGMSWFWDVKVRCDTVLVPRARDVIYPRGDTVLRVGDRLTLVGEIQAVREFARMCK